VTVPVAVAGDTLAVRVTGWPKYPGLGEMSSVVVVGGSNAPRATTMP